VVSEGPSGLPWLAARRAARWRGGWLADLTAWMPRSCRLSCVNAASMSYPAGLVRPSAVGMGLAGRQVVPGVRQQAGRSRDTDDGAEINP